MTSQPHKMIKDTPTIRFKFSRVVYYRKLCKDRFKNMGPPWYFLRGSRGLLFLFICLLGILLLLLFCLFVFVTYCQMTFPWERFWEGNMGVRGQFLEKRKLCVLTKERKQPPVVILQQAIFYNIFILCLWLRIIRRSDQGV